MAKKAVNPWRKKLQNIRAGRNWSQAEAAKFVGVTTRTWISWENGQRKPSASAQRLLGLLFPKK